MTTPAKDDDREPGATPSTERASEDAPASSDSTERGADERLRKVDSAAERKVAVRALFFECCERARVTSVLSRFKIEQAFTEAGPSLWEGDRFLVAPLREWMARQPAGGGFVDLSTPFLALAACADDLGLDIVLPPELAASSEGDRLRARAALELSDRTLDELFAQALSKSTAAAKVERERTRAERVASRAKAAPVRRAAPNGKLRLVAASLFALGSIALTVYVIRSTQTTHMKNVELPELASFLPVSHARLAEHTLMAQIEDPAWEKKSKSEQHGAAKRAFETLRKTRDVTVMTLVDRQQNTRVSASLGQGKSTVRVFYAGPRPAAKPSPKRGG